MEAVDDQHDPADPADIERSIALFMRLAELTSSDIEPPPADTPELSFALAGRFEFSADLKQELLDESSERIRLARLCELLAIAAETVERQREIAARAQTNGKVEPP